MVKGLKLLLLEVVGIGRDHSFFQQNSRYGMIQSTRCIITSFLEQVVFAPAHTVPWCLPDSWHLANQRTLLHF